MEPVGQQLASESEAWTHSLVHPHAHARYKGYLFGVFNVTRDDQSLIPLGWRRNKAKLLLKWLLLHPGDLFSGDQLCRLFWPDATGKGAVNNLSVSLHYLRHILEPELASGQTSTFIRRNRHNYYWFDFHKLWWTDILEVQHLITMAKKAEESEEFHLAFFLYNRILAYYSNIFLPEDIYEDIFAVYRHQHNYAHIQVMERTMQLSLRLGRYDDALSSARKLLQLNPYSESATSAIVQAYLKRGNTIGALRQLDMFRAILQEELGTELSNELSSLHLDILKTY